MKFAGAVSVLIASIGLAEATTQKLSSFTTLNKVLEDAFKNVPSLAKKDSESRRKLNNKIKAAARLSKSRGLDEGDDEGDDEQEWTQYDAYWNEDMVLEEFGFNIDQYSLKYTGCHVAGGWDDTIAENQNYDTVLGAETFVTFRLCPTEYCQGNDGYNYGCSENYGEYVLLLDAYVEALTEYRSEKKESFCQYCEICAAMKGYKSWNYMMQGSVAVLAETAATQFETWYENYQAQNGNAYQNEQAAKVAYMKLAKQQANNNNANNGNYNGDNMYGAYGNNNGNANANANVQYSYMDMSQVVGNEQKYWNFQSSSDIQNNGYQQQSDWMNINADYASFCGKPVLPGYYTDGGDFVEDYGYFNCYGNWVSFVEGEPFIWDECCMGEVPHGWEYIQGNDPEEFQECDAQYSQSCSSAYTECQFTLYYDEMEERYQELLNNAGGYDASVASELATFESVYAKQQSERVYSEALTCQLVDYVPEEEAMEENTYTNQQNYEQLYEQKQYYLQAEEDCGDDQDCIDAIESAMEKNNEYQLWIIESAWEEYQKYKELSEQFYVGAYCENNYDIGLRVFTEDRCIVEHPSATIQDVFDGEMKMSYDLVSSECIPCNDDQFNIDVEDGGADDNSVSGVLPFCSMLYQLSAKCNENLAPNKVYNAAGFYQDGVYYPPSFQQMYGSEQQQDNEKKICGFIDSLNSGTYKEDGSIYLGNLGWMSPEKWRNEVSAASSGMPKGMKSLIFIFVVCSAAMGLWAVVLRGALRRKNSPWQPKDPVDLARQESGIVMGRSRSGPANAPLI